MKRIFCNTISIILICVFVICANAKGFNYATTIYDQGGNGIPNKNIKLKISILEGSKDGNASYIEEFTTVTNAQGVANVIVGTGASLSGDFNELDWCKERFLKSEISLNNDNSFTLVNIIEISAVPYSFHSNIANSLNLKSPDGRKWDISVDESGNIVSKPIDTAKESPEYGTVDYIFDMRALPTITLEISTEEWNKILTNFDINPNNEENIACDFYFNKYGEIHQLKNIGLRLRGNTSRVRPEGNKGELHNNISPDWHHCHFAFRFEKFVDNNLFSGTDRFNLRWFKEDATYCHEIYSYDILRRFGVWSTMKSSYCRLKIKIKEDSSTAYMGVYEMFEGADDQYLADRQKSGNIKGTDGFLWKMSWGSGVGANMTKDQANEKFMGIEDVPLIGASSLYSYDYKSKKKKFPEAKAQLIQFIKDLNDKIGDDFIQWAETHINIDLLLRSIAATVAVGQWDDYWGNGNNYYLYFDIDGICHYIPYDFDNALGTSASGLMDNPGTRDPMNWGNANRPLVTKILAVPKWREQYKAYLKILASSDNDYIDADKSIARIKKWHALISQYVNNDTGEDCVIEDKTASWSSGVRNYRLLTGNDQGGLAGDPNFFRTKVRVIKELK